MTETESIRSVKLFIANPEGEALVLVRNLFCRRNPGQIDLPGGKQESIVDSETRLPRLETIEETALRELYEETGILPHRVALRGVAYAWAGSCDDGKQRVRHYVLGITEDEPLQFDDHQSALWVPPRILPKQLPNHSDALASSHVVFFDLLSSAV